MQRFGSGHSPLSGRDARFIVHPLFLWEDAERDEAMIEHARGYRADLRPWSTGAAYLNFVGDEGGARVRSAFGEDNMARLSQVKAAWDPANVFAGNQNIRPA